ncbi:ACP S-malonyltransferase [Maricaulaceae bacterium NA33B04]|nr:ACP S-malonyltransferase [Maricaulaceae bacterium NA33B04]
MALAFVFPGQGSQAVGMGEALASEFKVARDVFEEVDEALGQKLSHLMASGPAEELTLTENAQPAIMANSIATMRVLKAEFGVDVTAADYVAGHSLGEYSALCAAGSLSLSRTAILLKARGQAMQKAVAKGVGAMAALLGVTEEQAQAAVDTGSAKGVVTIANDNAPGQIVISGTLEAVEAALAAAKDDGARHAMMLDVSAPFHCPMMQPAAEAMAEALADATISAPVVPLVNNVSAEAVTDPEVIRAQLVDQVTGKVRWRESVDWMHGQGVDRFAEAGSKVLSNMLKRHVREAKGVPLIDRATLEAFAETLS